MSEIRFAIEQRAIGDGDHAGCVVDRESPAGIVGQRVADGVGRVQIFREGGDANGRPIGYVLEDLIDGDVGVAGRTDGRFVYVVDVDGEVRIGG